MMDVRLVFDRGSLVVEGLPREQDLSEIPGVLWNPRAGAYRAPAGAFYALASELRRRGVQLADRPLPRLGPPVPRSGALPGPDSRIPLGAWRLAGRRGIAVLPSESARVQLAVAAIQRSATPALLLASTPGLAARWKRALAACFEGVQCLDEPAAIAAPVTVATFTTAYRSIWRLGDHFGLLVVDDVHELGRGFPDEVLEMCTAPLRLGLTGTAPPEGALRARLASLVGPVVFEVTPAERLGDYLPSFERIRWHLRPAQPHRAYELLLDHHGVAGTLIFTPGQGSPPPPDAARMRPAQPRRLAEALAAGRVRPLAAASARSPAAWPAAEAAIIATPAARPREIRDVARLLSPPEGARARIYELACPPA